MLHIVVVVSVQVSLGLKHFCIAMNVSIPESNQQLTSLWIIQNSGRTNFINARISHILHVVAKLRALCKYAKLLPLSHLSLASLCKWARIDFFICDFWQNVWLQHPHTPILHNCWLTFTCPSFVLFFSVSIFDQDLLNTRFLWFSEFVHKPMCQLHGNHYNQFCYSFKYLV